MSERLPEAETLATYEVHGRSLADWHNYLCTDQEGQSTGRLLTPCSRYGRNTEQCAWWAIACEVIFVSANGGDDEPETSLEFYMGLAVNDSVQVAYMVDDYYYVVPECLKEVVGTKEEIDDLIEGTA